MGARGGTLTNLPDEPWPLSNMGNTIKELGLPSLKDHQGPLKYIRAFPCENFIETWKTG